MVWYVGANFDTKFEVLIDQFAPQSGFIQGFRFVVGLAEEGAPKRILTKIVCIKKRYRNVGEFL